MSSPTFQTQFAFETELVKALMKQLEADSLFKKIKSLAVEFDYASGRTDVIGVCCKQLVHAFEAKLKNWKVALHQARRNTCYAHYSYVVLPEGQKSALKKRIDFVRSGVGLIIVGESTVRVAIRAEKHVPIMPWLTSRAVALANPTPNAHLSLTTGSKCDSRG